MTKHVAVGLLAAAALTFGLLINTDPGLAVPEDNSVHAGAPSVPKLVHSQSETRHPVSSNTGSTGQKTKVVESMPTWFGYPVSISLDPASFLLSVVALWLAFTAIRITTRSRIKITRFAFSWHRNVEGVHLAIRAILRSMALPIHNPEVFLEFTYFDDEGIPTRFSQSLEPSNPRDGDAFHTGSQNSFENLIKTPLSEVDCYGVQAFARISRNSIRKCNPRISVRCNGIEVAGASLLSRFEWPIKLWNKLAALVNRRFDRSFKTPSDRQFFIAGSVLPRFGLDAAWELNQMASGIEQELLRAGFELDAPDGLRRISQPTNESNPE